MNDMRSVIIPKSDQLNADSLIGGPLTIQITEVTIRPGTEQPVSVHYTGDDGKPWKPCKSMARVMVTCWGADANNYVGRSLTIFCDPAVVWGGMKVGGIRISHMSDIAAPQTMALTATKGSKKIFTVKPLAVAPSKAAVADPAKPDKSTEVAASLIARIVAAGSMELQSLTADPVVIKQRAWLAKNRPELADRVDAAVHSALAVFEAADEPEIEA